MHARVHVRTPSCHHLWLLTTRTGTSASRMMFCATLPRKALPIGERRRAPMTSRSGPSSCTVARIASETSAMSRPPGTRRTSHWRSGRQAASSALSTASEIPALLASAMSLSSDSTTWTTRRWVPRYAAWRAPSWSASPLELRVWWATATLMTPPRSLLQLVRELGELVTAGHLAGQLVETHVGALLVEHGLAELEDDEVVADEVRVVRVVGDEDDAEAGVAGRSRVLQHHAGLLDAEGRGRLVEDEHAGAEVDGAGDRDALALAAREGADGLVDVLDDDAHLAQLLVGDALHVGDPQGGERAPPAGQLGAEEEVAPHLHERDDGEVLVDRRDAVVEGLARRREADLLAVDLHRALVVRVEAGHDLDQGRLAGAVVAEDAGHLAGAHREVDALEGADGAVRLADVLHLDERLARVELRVRVLGQGVSHVSPPFGRSRAS